MNINSVNYAAHAASVTISKDKDSVTVEASAASVSVSQTTVSTDSYTPSERPAKDVGALTYAPPKKLTGEQIETLKRQVQESMQAMVEKMLGAQANIAKKEDGSTDFVTLAKNLGMGTTPETAAAAISEDGMWGVDAVATRLMDMALSLSGGDPEKAGILREAVRKGFEAVGDIESLPQVCQDTYAEVMKRFDYWETNGTMDGYGKTEETA